MSYGEKEKEKEKKEAQIIYLPDEEKEGKKCPQCGETNELEARFCAECGYDFSGGRQCPKCKAKVSIQADICEISGEWLLKGKCKLCNSDIEEDDTYCGECGNPVEGIACSQCGQLSYFDFCKHCGIPLTETAKRMLEEIKNDPTEQKLLSLDISIASEGETSESKELHRVKAYREKIDKQESAKKVRKVSRSLFSDKHKESLKEIGKEIDEETKRREEIKRKEEAERRRKAEEERKKREEVRRQLQALLDKMKTKTFSTNQDARRYFMSHKPKNATGWLCNAYDCVHDSPCDCAAPEQGGVWLI